MSQHENAPENFVKTFNAAWDIGLKSCVGVSVVLLAMFFYNLFDSFVAFFAFLIFAAICYGAYNLLSALLVGPADPDAENNSH